MQKKNDISRRSYVYQNHTIKSANKRYNTKYLKIQQIQNTMIYTDSDAYNKTIRRFSAWMTL